MSKQKLNESLSSCEISKKMPEPFLKWTFEINENTGGSGVKSIEMSDGSKLSEEGLTDAIKRASGVDNPAVGERVIRKIAYGLSADSFEHRINEVCALLPGLEPRNQTEGLLFGQFMALNDSGMKCLHLANLPDQGFYHIEKLFTLANKLFNTANQTVQTIMKCRTGGQQTIQVVHLHNEGQAIVAQNLSTKPFGGGDQEKS